jgi:hypothetical protein
VLKKPKSVSADNPTNAVGGLFIRGLQGKNAACFESHQRRDCVKADLDCDVALKQYKVGKVGLPPLFDSLDDWHTLGRYGLPRNIISGGKPTFPTFYCAEVRQCPALL